MKTKQNLLIVLTFTSLLLFFGACKKPKTTPAGGELYGRVTDIEGNSYKTVVIGKQVWMAENLKVTKYNDNTPIANIINDTAWINDTIGAYCYYDYYAGKPVDKNIYGALYTWHAATNSKGICPTGWHIPENAEWDTLITFLGGDSLAALKMKTTGTEMDGTGLWHRTYSPLYHPAATNNSGFSAVPGGHKIGFHGSGRTPLSTSYEYLTESALFISGTSKSSYLSISWGVYLEKNYNFPEFKRAFSIRCLKD